MEEERHGDDIEEARQERPTGPRWTEVHLEVRFYADEALKYVFLLKTICLTNLRVLENDWHTTIKPPVTMSSSVYVSMLVHRLTPNPLVYSLPTFWYARSSYSTQQLQVLRHVLGDVFKQCVIPTASVPSPHWCNSRWFARSDPTENRSIKCND